MGWTFRGSNPGVGEIFRTCPDRFWGPPSLLYNGYRVFLRGKERPGRDADPSPLLVPLSRKNKAIPNSPYGPYELYRASVPVQRCTLPLPIPLLPVWAVRPVQSLSACTTVHCNFTYTSTPLWAVRPVQSLSACTTVHCTFTYTSTPPMGRTACTETQCLYNGAL